jgi:hypothetical protein
LFDKKRFGFQITLSVEKKGEDMWFVVIFFCTLVIGTSEAETKIDYNIINEATTWTESGSPYYLLIDVLNIQAPLIIDDGVQVIGLPQTTLTFFFFFFWVQFFT